MDETPADLLRERIRRELGAAMKARRADEVAALRAVVAAVDNAEAVDAAPTRETLSSSPHISGAVSGVGSTEAVRRELSVTDLREILVEEAAGLDAQASSYDALGRTEEARRLRGQADVIRHYQVEMGGESR